MPTLRFVGTSPRVVESIPPGVSLRFLPPPPEAPAAPSPANAVELQGESVDTEFELDDGFAYLEDDPDFVVV